MKQLLLTLIVVAATVGLIVMVVFGSRDKAATYEAGGELVLAETSSALVLDNLSDVDILYWGTTCPHCHDVIGWMEANRIEDKVKVVRREVYGSREGFLELVDKAKICGIDESSLGVPFMFTSEGECLSGVPDITAYLSGRAGLTEALGLAEPSGLVEEGL